MGKLTKLIDRNWKSIIAGLGIAITLITSANVGDPIPEWVPVVTGALTTLLVWMKANAPKESPPAIPPQPPEKVVER